MSFISVFPQLILSVIFLAGRTDPNVL